MASKIVLKEILADRADALGHQFDVKGRQINPWVETNGLFVGVKNHKRAKLENRDLKKKMNIFQ